VIKGLDLQTRLLPGLLKKGINVHLHLVGPDDGEGAGLERLASELGVADRIHQHGPIYGEERLRWLHDADAVLLTSHYECNSVTAAETLAVGGVLVATDTCHLGRAGDAGAAIVTPRDPLHLVEALSGLLSEVGQLSDIRRRASAFAQQNLEWRSLAGQMVDFYRRLIKSGQPCVE
jgi:glycogen(starch) synthase